jgi:signal transduction histidine kinase/ligand-binding sensor domain-containing protein/DNA-binding response OmpR family regulator
MITSFFRTVCVFALVLCTALRASAQSVQAIFENYTLENGLQNNTVQQAFQDSRGYLWFATNQGVCRYDGTSFRSFRNDPNDPNSLSGLLARVIYEDKRGNLWIGTESGGLNRFSREKENFEHIQSKDRVNGIGTSVKTIAEDGQGRLWLGTNIGIKMYDPLSGQVRSFPYRAADLRSPSDTYVRVLQFDTKGRLWVGTNAGLDLFDPSTAKFTRIHQTYPQLSDEIWEIYSDPKGLLWVGTYNNGLFSIDPSTLTLQKINLDGKREWSNTIRSVTMDEKGTYWIGSRAGLYSYDPRKKSTVWYGNIENEPRSLVNNSVLNVYKDAGKNLWICTRGGMSLLVPGRQLFKHYRGMNNNSWHLNNKEVYAAWEHPETGNIWIGTGEGGINILHRNTETFSYVYHVPGRGNDLSGNGIKAFMEDGKGNVWIGTDKEGISVYNLKTARFGYFLHEPAKASSLSSNNIWALHRDKKGNIWVGSDAGLDLFDPRTRSFLHQKIGNKSQQVSWIAEDNEGNLWLGLLSVVAIYKPGTGILELMKAQGSCFFQDSKGRSWLATKNNGLLLLQKNRRPIKYYDERNGLANNQVFQILEDNGGKLWLSTANGLAMFDPAKGTFINFDKRDGLQDNQFHYGAAFKLASGELIFGGVNGFNLFDPAKMARNSHAPPAVLTDLKILNRSVQVGDETKILDRSIAETKKLRIPYSYNVITLEFAALNFVRPEKNTYRFKLAGFDKNWNESGRKSSATYTNLDPGGYTFLVMAANNDGLWSKRPLQIEIEIIPPFWKTWWFRVLAIAAILILTHQSITFILNREKIKQQLDMERIKAKQSSEVSDMKLRFFTNVSHEIRTPLSLLIGPLERIKHTEMTSEQIKEQADLMYRNTNSLLKLVNQLLDYRKLETGRLELELRTGDIIEFIREIVASFAPWAQDKAIKLDFTAPSKSMVTFFDAEKLEKILNNLLTNAIKFTNKNGKITVYLAIAVEESAEGYDQYLEITVRDNGIGIEEKDYQKIFQRFYQIPSKKSGGGTGIGLALTKELVELHNGRIIVDSIPAKYTKFTVRLPVVQSDGTTPVKPPHHEPDNSNNINSPVAKKELLCENILLIIEDNADVRTFIRSSFEDQFHIEEAVDGVQGLQLAQKLLPDIILSDVMMPLMDGNELCRKLKADEYTSHIPIILLTALASKQHTIQGLSSGADDYITKPFDVSILQSKIENLLLLRNSMRKKFASELILSGSQLTYSSPDELFLRRAVQVVEDNISDSDLDIETFARAMAVSRMQLYRKLSALTGMTVKEFIRDIRLKRAIQLFDHQGLNISEVAYAVGFGDLSHFRKCFREKFGLNATTYLKNKEL